MLGPFLIATELLGLLDVVNQPDFVSHGGWLQSPFTSVALTTTLPNLFIRYSIDILTWIIASNIIISTAISSASQPKLCTESIAYHDVVWHAMAFFAVRIIGILAILGCYHHSSFME
jgi:hypothetical protein